MPKSTKPGSAPDGDPVAAYALAQPPALRAVCERLHGLIAAALPAAAVKVWHGSPVWFLGDNPVVGYDATAKAVNLLFWNGQAFGDVGLTPVGQFRAARAVFGDAAAVDAGVVRGWLKKAGADVFDSKAFFQKLRAERAPARPAGGKKQPRKGASSA